MKRVVGRMSLLALLCLAGCATPERRIRHDPALFASFPAEAQAKIRQGQIEIGFSKAMVTMALGRPDRIRTRHTAAGPVAVWSYVDVRSETYGWPVDRGFWYTDRAGRTRWASDWWGPPTRQVVSERLRVEFEGDRVKAFETVNE